MLLRISLIVVILAGIGAFYFGHMPVAEKINTLTTDLDASRLSEQQARDAERKARAEAAQAKVELEEANETLADTQNKLQETAQNLAAQQKRANQLFQDLGNVTRERNVAQQELAAYQVAGVAPEQIRAQREQLEKAQAELETYIGENKILLRNVKRLEFELSRFIGQPQEVVLPAGLKGKVLAVDPRYNFVVLDIGENQGVLQDGEMLVSRNGKLVGKVRITRVEPNRSIANIMPEWLQPESEVMEGDAVLY